MITCFGVCTTLMVLNYHVNMYGNPSGSHLPAGSLVSTESTCRTPGPEGLFFFSASSPAGVYGSGLAIPVSSSRPPSAPRPPGSSAGCSLAPLTPSVCAASQIPDMSRRGAGPLDFLPSYADRRGGTLFHFSSCARRRGAMIPAAMTATIETTRRLDISEPSSRVSSLQLLELFAVDHDTTSDLPDGLPVLRPVDLHAHFISGFERVLAPASAGLGDGIPGFENPVRDVAGVVLGIHFHQDVRIRPHVFRHRSVHGHQLP